ncbi:tyrosine-type recombinase/integrase [candidate division KSB1 bacterium]
MQWTLTPDKYLNEEEVKRLTKVCSDASDLAERRGYWIAVRDWMIIDLTLNTGLRVQEVSDLKVSNLFLNYNESSLVVESGKGGKRRVVRFGPKTKTHLKKYLESQEPSSQFLFCSSRGEKLTRSALQKIFKKWAKRAELPSHHSFHSMRHYHACHLYKISKNNLRLVQQQLGHASVNTTTVYAQVMDEDAEEAFNRFEGE